MHPDKLKLFDPHYIQTMTRNGQQTQFVSTDGLVDRLHQIGFNEIKTQLVCTPTSDNRMLAVFHCSLLAPDGKRFEAHGDATPDSVPERTQRRYVAAAETRAIVRAASLALNIEGALDADADEYESTSQHHPAQTARPAPQTQAQPQPPPTSSQTRGNGHAPPPSRDQAETPATEPQVKAIFAKCKALGLDKPDEVRLRAMTKDAASKAIEQLAAREHAVLGAGEDPEPDDTSAEADPWDLSKMPF